MTTSDPCAPRPRRAHLRAADRTFAFASLLTPVETLRDLAASIATGCASIHFTHHLGDAWYGVLLDGAVVLVRGVIHDAPVDTDLRWRSTALLPFLSAPPPGKPAAVEAFQMFLDAIPLATDPPVPGCLTAQYARLSVSVPALTLDRILRRLDAEGPCRFGIFTLDTVLLPEPSRYLVLAGEGWRVFLCGETPDPTAPRYVFDPERPAFVACASCGRVASYEATEAEAFAVAEATGFRDVVLATARGRVTASQWCCPLHHDSTQGFVTHGGP